MTKDIVISIMYVMALACVLVLIIQYEPTRRKLSYFSNVPNINASIFDRMMANEWIKDKLHYMTTGNGIKNDSPEKLMKDVLRSCIYAAIGYGIFFAIGLPVVGFAVAILFICWEFIHRIVNKGEYKKKYISSFYTFLNYIILYLSGGVDMRTSIIEVNKLIDDNSPIKARLNEVVAKNAITGLAGDTYIDALKALNKDLNYSEINNFISTAKRTQERGDPIVPALLSQIDDIYKKVEIDKRSFIANQDNIFSSLQIPLCMMPALLAFMIPMFLSAFKALSMF